MKKKPSTPLASSSRPPMGIIRKNTPQMTLVEESSLKEQDERYRYLLKYGKLHKTLNKGNIIFCELGQIPGVWICYRRPTEREGNPEKLELDSMDFEHVPLFEGEENLKILSLKQNKIRKIENMVSLPNLVYIDFTENIIEIIENIENLSNLRVFSAPKNLISACKSINLLKKLEVLDLHSNKIQKIAGLDGLKMLKILNLADNFIKQIEGLDTLENLKELNLKKNQIKDLNNFENLNNLQKLYLCENNIETLPEEEYTSLFHLEEIALDGNPVTSIKDYSFKVFSVFPALKILDHKEKNSYYLDENNENSKKFSRNEILEIIQEQWNKALKNFQKNKNDKEKDKDIFILDSGHAEVDMDTSLFIYGNAYKFVLFEEKYYKKIKKIFFKFVFFDHLTESEILQALIKFINLEELSFFNNNIHSLLQISKLEALPKLRNLEINENPICNSTILNDFIVYRFPKIQKVNGIPIEDDENSIYRKKAKFLFENFDKILQLPEKIPKGEHWQKNHLNKKKANNKQVSMKHISRAINEASEKFLGQILFEAQQENNIRLNFEKQWDNYINLLVSNSLK